MNHNNEEHQYDSEQRLERIRKEFEEGFSFVDHLDQDKTVTFWGSARFPEGDEHYEQARELAKMLGEEGFTVVTGGGGGIMAAGNQGAMEANAGSVGLNIQLPTEQRINKYVREGMGFYYFFTRKVMMAFSAQAYVFFPGGFGTLDEFFEIITLIQTKKIQDDIPVILIGEDYWRPLAHWLERVVYERHQAVDPEDLRIWTITDDLDEALEIVLSSLPRKRF
ncbi:MAG: TIGR00730 family Rossman fold protein [Candidatus Harrisonbacteria bacterium CG10_big_fil_rev_8_21_14_0_10_49_15]|uniref:Cytokinin riboside 5'-monophosphate phosphoribohydrolase n=1 Tax=Candidatus Harrisonbacteria bacterium CG10_big_fil_rev_8_21_14_0_10_49_15 TaxID=1974587 RepID=A0A2H0UKS0_9BACT|nr:MAG: TIGR00730 family Rossman fold protein [Candidatus Harrisonbacteria bacterium CG10_big_fil_rev_8_21_14_0_10_49_15]